MRLADVILLAALIPAGGCRRADHAAGTAQAKLTPLKAAFARAGESAEKELGVRLYPGARIESTRNASDSENVRTCSLTYETPDPVGKVADFYRAALGDQADPASSKHSGAVAFNAHADWLHKWFRVSVFPDKSGAGSRVVIVRPLGEGDEREPSATDLGVDLYPKAAVREWSKEVGGEKGGLRWEATYTTDDSFDEVDKFHQKALGDRATRRWVPVFDAHIVEYAIDQGGRERVTLRISGSAMIRGARSIEITRAQGDGAALEPTGVEPVLPIYPGATLWAMDNRVTTIRVRKYTVTCATSDPVDKVDQFYRDALGEGARRGEWQPHGVVYHTGKDWQYDRAEVSMFPDERRHVTKIMISRPVAKRTESDEPSEKLLGVKLYPHGELSEWQKESEGLTTVSWRAVYATNDSWEQVADFYRKALGKEPGGHMGRGGQASGVEFFVTGPAPGDRVSVRTAAPLTEGRRTSVTITRTQQEDLEEVAQ
jgi:hypothetical protein